MSSPSKENEEPTSSVAMVQDEAGGSGGDSATSEAPRPPAKRPLSTAVIEISDTDTDDSDVCAVNSYQASADEVKRIRGDYSSSSSSSDYSSDSESPWEDDSIVIDDKKVDIKAVKAQLNPRANRMDDPILNPALKAQETKENLAANWKEFKDFSNDVITLTCKPFRVCQLNSFLANPEIINNIVDDMNTLDWERKKMDLYEFHQTADLANLTWQRSIRGIYELLKTDVMSWVSEVTGMELTSVSASCSLYGPGDHLLVHDDLLADRRVAFILYLAPWALRPTSITLENGSGDNHKQPVVSVDVDVDVDVDVEWSGWCAEMGGALELLERGAEGPTRAARRLLPANNMLALFKVDTDSYHQVEEVLSMELPRLSINGWFHGPAPPAPPPPAPPAPLYRPPHNQPVLVNQWLEATYMSPRCRAQIQSQMERESEVCLRNFLQPEKYQELLQALQAPDVEWEWVGPLHQRHYERLSPSWVSASSVAHPAIELLQVVGSSAFCRLLATCTDLPLQRLATPTLQRWTPGCFTLLPPRSHYQAARLEAVLYVGAPARRLAGGCTVYAAPEGDGDGDGDGDGEGDGHGDGHGDRHGDRHGDGHGEGALVTLPPVSNALNLVYCDAGAAAFTKYLSRLAMRDTPPFYILTATYCE